MAIEITVFLMILAFAGILFLSGIIFRFPILFLFGCVLLFGCGALLWGSNGLILNYYYNSSGSLSTTVFDMTNLGMQMFALILVSIPIISFFVIDFFPTVKRSGSPFHY